MRIQPQLLENLAEKLQNLDVKNNMKLIRTQHSLQQITGAGDNVTSK